MQSLAHRYPEFGEKLMAPELQEAIAEDTLEDIQLASFDAGYRAGWDDAAKAQAKNADSAVIDVAQNIQDMSFTHHEAYLKLSAAMHPLLTQIMGKLLPRSAQKLVGLHLVDQLRQLMDGHAQGAIEIAVAPDNLTQLQELLQNSVTVPFSVAPDPSLGAGQAYLRSSKGEQEINLDAVIAGMSDAIDAFYDQTRTERSND